MLSAWLIAAALAGDPEALYSACRAADRVVDGQAALEACGACLREDPWGQRATFCGGRVSHYRARRDLDGGFEGLTALEQARRGRPDIAALIAHMPSASPEVAVETSLWLAARRQAEQGDAAALEALELADAQVLMAQPSTARRWSVRRAELLAKLGREDEARAAAASLRSGALTVVDEVVRARRLAWAQRVAAGLTAVWLLVAVPLAAQGWRQAPRPVPAGLAPLLVALVATVGLVWAWDEAALPSALGLALVLPLSHLLATGALRQRPSLALRLVMAVGTAALSWWTLDRTGGLQWLLP